MRISMGLPSRVELTVQKSRARAAVGVRTVNVGEKNLYMIGGQSSDNDFLQSLGHSQHERN